MTCRARRRAVCCLVLFCLGALPRRASIRAQAAGATYQAYLPLIVQGAGCEPLPLQEYILLSPDSPGPTIPVETHPDHNLSVRGYEQTAEYCGLVHYPHEHDPLTPQCAGLFTKPRLPRFVSTYQVYDWDWGRMQRAPLITNPPVTALGLETLAGEILHVPDSGYTIGQGCEVLVIYAATDQITLKYTREDNVVYGYTLHIDRICVDPVLLSLYDACDNAGRASLPALRPLQPFGRARGDQIVIAIADTGMFLDPRSHVDWWRDY